MKWLIAMTFLWGVPGLCATSHEFVHVQQLAQAYLVREGVAADDIQRTYLPYLSGGLPNSKQIEHVADVAFLIHGQGTRYVQLFRMGGKWQVMRALPPGQLAAAYPLLIDEYRDEYWRETERLKQRVAMDLQTQLIAARRIEAVKSARPRCFVDLKHNKALCDIYYTTWDATKAQCVKAARLFARTEARWSEVPGQYHSGMRINPSTGEIFVMIPEEGC